LFDTGEYSSCRWIFNLSMRALGLNHRYNNSVLLLYVPFGPILTLKVAHLRQQTSPIDSHVILLSLKIVTPGQIVGCCHHFCLGVVVQSLPTFAIAISNSDDGDCRTAVKGVRNGAPSRRLTPSGLSSDPNTGLH
jgi:hypothetical protein